MERPSDAIAAELEDRINYQVEYSGNQQRAKELTKPYGTVARKAPSWLVLPMVENGSFLEEVDWAMDGKREMDLLSFFQICRQLTISSYFFTTSFHARAHASSAIALISKRQRASPFEHRYSKNRFALPAPLDIFPPLAYRPTLTV
jgi:hypothetical protein